MLILKSVSDNLIEKLTFVLNHGGVVVLPTETCYGLSCDATNEEAVEKIFQIKKREKGKPLSVMFFDLDMIEKYATLNEQALDLAAKFWPGPLTLVLPRKEKTKLYGIEGKSVGVRMPDHRLCLKLLYQTGLPLITTSANLSGTANPYSASEIIKQFEGAEFQPDILVDAGELAQTPPSTVADLTGKKAKVLRQGEITIDQ